MSKHSKTKDLAARARKAYDEAREEAVDFAQRAQAAAATPRPAEPTATDQIVARALKRLGEKGAAQLKDAEAYLNVAAWLPERPTLTSVLLERGAISQRQLQMIQKAGKQDTRKQGTQDVNTRYGRAAVQVGYVSNEQVQWALKRIPQGDRGKLVIPQLLARQGLLSQEQHDHVVSSMSSRA